MKNAKRMEMEGEKGASWTGHILKGDFGADLRIICTGYSGWNFSAIGMEGLEGLEDLLQNISLSSKELGGADLGQEDVRKVIHNCQRSLIRKVIGGEDGHADKNCKQIGNCNLSNMKPQFGSWMRANGEKTSAYEKHKMGMGHQLISTNQLQKGNEEINAKMLEINQANSREEKGENSGLELDIIGGFPIPSEKMSFQNDKKNETKRKAQSSQD
ncbi:hypothetical protein ACH5RR_000709 [Cinchona calisaya]|uniref:Uncharacterized protein n=1 Tax=Cinchona calisaya TaxID=153742 RepID=A0ABD3B1Z6_9GENT